MEPTSRKNAIFSGCLNERRVSLVDWFIIRGTRFPPPPVTSDWFLITIDWDESSSFVPISTDRLVNILLFLVALLLLTRSIRCTRRSTPMVLYVESRSCVLVNNDYDSQTFAHFLLVRRKVGRYAETRSGDGYREKTSIKSADPRTAVSRISRLENSWENKWRSAWAKWAKWKKI